MNKHKQLNPYNQLPSLSIFLPCYNEETNIEKQLNQVLKVAPRVAREFEIIVINDGSTDATKAIIKQMASINPHIRLVSQHNKGYGGAVKRGFAESKHEWVFFTDSDLQFDVNELVVLVKAVKCNDMVLGYRLKRADGRKRHLLAKGLKLWNRMWLGFPRNIKDIDCAFKLIKRDVITRVQPLVSDGAMMSTEFLLKAHRAGFIYSQVGVHHYDRLAGSATGSNLGVIWKAIVDTFVLRKVLFKQTDLGRQLVEVKHMMMYLLVSVFMFWSGWKR
jgi:glycosyltransferase involved in cell wall biosynthesis